MCGVKGGGGGGGGGVSNAHSGPGSLIRVGITVLYYKLL